jgi:hypothetical protein
MNGVLAVSGCMQPSVIVAYKNTETGFNGFFHNLPLAAATFELFHCFQ